MDTNVSESGPEALRFRRGNRLLMGLTTLILSGLIATLAVFAVTLLLSPRVTHDLAIRMSLPWLPAVFYIWILWILRGLFSDLAAGGMRLQPGLSRALPRIGLALMLGALTTLAVAPLVNMLTSPHRLGGQFVFDLPSLALVMVGLALMVLARMLNRARALEAEAQQMREELESFI